MNMTRDEFVLKVKQGAIFHCTEKEQTVAVMKFLKDCGFPLYGEDEGENPYHVDYDFMNPGCDSRDAGCDGEMPIICGWRNGYVEKALMGDLDNMDDFRERHPSGIIPYEKIAKLISGEEQFADEAYNEEEERKRNELFLTLLTHTA